MPRVLVVLAVLVRPQHERLWSWFLRIDGQFEGLPHPVGPTYRLEPSRFEISECGKD